MICPKCDRNHLRGKEGMVCRCGYEFIFDPKRHNMTDGKFLATMRRASANHTYRFTENQFYASACRRLKFSFAGLVGIPMALFGAFFVWKGIQEMGEPGDFKFFGTIFGGFWLLVGIVLAFTLMGPRLKRKRWNKLVKRWIKVNGEVAGLIRPGDQLLAQPPPEYSEKDIYDYGVERIVICQHDYLVDWLVLNRFHFNQRVAVIGESGYPNYLLPVINQLLAGPEPPDVYLMHDAGSAGGSMKTRVCSSGVFAFGSARVIDLGIDEVTASEIRSLKKVSRSMRGAAMPVDTIPFGQLQALSGIAFAADCGMVELIEPGSTTTTEFSAEFESGCSDDGDGE